MPLSATESNGGRVGQLIHLRGGHHAAALHGRGRCRPTPLGSIAGGRHGAFDRSGRLAGVATGAPDASGDGTFPVMSATEALGVAEQLLGEQR